MAGEDRESVDSDYSGRPLPDIPVTDKDRSGPPYDDDDAVVMDVDGRPVYTDSSGSYEVIPGTSDPDHSRPVDDPYPALEDFFDQ